MEKSEREQINDLANQIIGIESVVKLSKEEGYKIILEKISSARIDAVSRALSPGDTTDAKAFAIAWGMIADLFYSIPNGVELDNLIDMKQSLERDIKVRENTENEFNSGQYNGGNSML